jgi:hypothetical protein
VGNKKNDGGTENSGRSWDEKLLGAGGKKGDTDDEGI